MGVLPVFVTLDGIVASPYASGSVAVAVLAFCLVAVFRRRTTAGAPALVALTLGVGWWALTYGLELAAVSLSGKLFFAKVAYFGVVVIPVAWMVFALHYSGYSHRVTRRLVGGLSVAPVAHVCLLWTTEHTGLVWTTTALSRTATGPTVLSVSYGPSFWLWAAYAYVLLAVGTVLIVRTALSANAVFKQQGGLLLLGAVVPWAGNAVNLAGYGPFGLDPTPFAFVVSTLALAIATSQYHLAVVTPATRLEGHETLVEQLDVGVVVLEADGRVVDFNRCAATLLDTTVDAALGRDLAEVDPLLAAAATTEADLERDGQTYTVRTTSLGDPATEEGQDAVGTNRGTLLTLTDVTEARTREQKLTVLNRVLRHDLKNDVSVLAGFVRLLRNEPDKLEFLDVIEERVSSMGELVETVASVETALGDKGSAVGPQNLVPLVDNRVDAVANTYPDAQVFADLPADAWVVASELVTSVVDNVVENAVEHADGTPHVDVSLRRRRGDDQWVDFVVADEGPGIPPADRAVLVGDPDADLARASGLGLWLVNQVVTNSDGTVTYAENEPRGSVVTVSLPATERGTGQNESTVAFDHAPTAHERYTSGHRPSTSSAGSTD